MFVRPKLTEIEETSFPAFGKSVYFLLWRLFSDVFSSVSMTKPVLTEKSEPPAIHTASLPMRHMTWRGASINVVNPIIILHDTAFEDFTT